MADAAKKKEAFFKAPFRLLRKRTAVYLTVAKVVFVYRLVLVVL
jgi:hypothetical protein